VELYEVGTLKYTLLGKKTMEDISSAHHVCTCYHYGSIALWFVYMLIQIANALAQPEMEGLSYLWGCQFLVTNVCFDFYGTFT